MIETLQRVTHKVCYTFDRILRAYNHHTVAHLQRQVLRSKDIHTRTVHTGYVHPMNTTEVQFAQTLAIHLRLSNQDSTRYHRSILLFPIHLYGRTDESNDSFGIILGTNHIQLVAYMEDCITIRDADMTILQDTRDNELTPHELLHLHQSLPVQGFVTHFQVHLVRSEMRVGSCLSGKFFFFLLHVDTTNQSNGNNRSDDT